ncbi:acyl-CoA desaturase [Rheinheimera baltica]|uniref:fatty acid desaturase family protein n=1 Tax=Rheinheimera baltica TaxID=67576 RepID=UPI00273FED69|nr:acyl-CoA desaturase [Rheinheimera baltica]MDP5142978.1 acyl-CoA desaturase [Rheinheimera baltica]MDP5149683.1 acyl-CoA desaturase [Rheinheimera baltica]
MKLTIEQFSALEHELDTVKQQVKAQLGEQDARYIRRVLLVQRLSAISGRILLVLGFITPWLWLVGVLLLALGKILDNMEIGHNVLHGQYDWMNDPVLHSKRYEWDIACDAGSWQRTHNFEHHTYTNIIGKDRDFGYGLLRLSNDFRWRVRNLWQGATYLLLSMLFQWGVSYHELAAQRVFAGKKKADRHSQVSDSALKKAFFSKGARQLIKDYLFFPLIAGPMWLWVLSGNLLANLIRNLWTSTVIFCGHFTKDVHVFTAAQCENESRGQWYYRQMLGSSNFTGPTWLHILTGHLSCQIEHHLFPDIPARHYPAMAKQVQAIAAKYAIPYNTGSFVRQYSTVFGRIMRYSLPGGGKAVKAL